MIEFIKKLTSKNEKNDDNCCNFDIKEVSENETSDHEVEKKE
ncbi:hypothetical protein [Aquibacillus saliphilus]|nr:hypothetical protein [Aquibacillus saliphilus]